MGDLARQPLELARRRGAASAARPALGSAIGAALRPISASRLAAAARAASVTLAPASMRAISSRRSSAASGTTATVARPRRRRLLDPPVMVGARRDLRRMGHHQHLGGGADPGEALADRIGGGAADAAVDLVEHQARRRADLGERHLERQHQPRELAARGDLGRAARAPGRGWRRSRRRPARRPRPTTRPPAAGSGGPESAPCRA